MFAQVNDNENGTKANIEKHQEVKNKQIKVDLEKIPHSVLLTLRDSYAKHFVMKAYKTNKLDDIYFVQLQKSRKWFTVAVTNKGRVLKEIHQDMNTNKEVIVKID